MDNEVAEPEVLLLMPRLTMSGANLHPYIVYGVYKETK